jgi:hypothetical protein
LGKNHEVFEESLDHERKRLKEGEKWGISEVNINGKNIKKK